MHRIASSLTSTCVYSTERIAYCEVIRATIHTIFRNGHKVFSAYVGPNTRVIFRSESARMIHLIQMSQEMWNFEENGDIMFNKLVNSFLPELFKKWRDEGLHHLVTIVLFTSIDLSGSTSRLSPGERGSQTQDYYRVVVDQVHISKWNDIMGTLRYEFARFAKEILRDQNGNIRGSILPAVKGNLLEAINLATTLISSKFADRDLRRTGVQMLVITPGSGLYDVDYDLFYQTSMKLLSIEVGIDLVCLSQLPLHVTPLFRYRTSDQEVVNCVPSWLDISFWNSNEKYFNQWIPACKIYQIQMMGVMENEVSAITIDYLRDGHNGSEKLSKSFMKEYDENLFKSRDAIENLRLLEEAVSSDVSSALLRPKVSTLELAPRSQLRTVSHSLPATAIISSPAIDNETTSSALLTNTIKNKPRISALSSLFSLGKANNGKDPFSSNSYPNSPNFTHVTPSNDVPAASGLLDPVYADEMRMTSSTIDSVTKPDGQLKTKPSIVRQLSHTISLNNLHKNDLSATRRSQLSSSPQSNTSTSPSNKATTQQENQEEFYIWVTVANPSNVDFDRILNITNYGRWQNVFPNGVKRKAVKWRSLKTPASLPLATEIFPSVEEFTKNYTFQIYDITLNWDHDDTSTAGNLLEEMVALRLHIGFQIVVGDRVSQVEAQRRQGGNPSLIVQTVPRENYQGVRIYMTRSNQIHRLECDHLGTINVQLYTKRHIPRPEDNFKREYHPFIKTKFSSQYEKSLGNIFDPSIREVKWNVLDQQLSGFGDMEGSSERMFKVRFVIVPSTIKPGLTEGVNEKLTPEELRVEGLRKVISLIHRGSYQTPEEKKRLKGRKKEKIPPEIKFYTGDLGSYLLQLYEEYNITDSINDKNSSGSVKRKDSLLVSSLERLNKSIKLTNLAVEMQDSLKGIRLVDRRWHLKLHKNCFIGQEFVAWMLDTFTDIHTSDEAVAYGKSLMNSGLFHHVENRHSFLNGHYFYQLNPEYIIQTTKDKEKTGWFRPGHGRKVSDLSANYSDVGSGKESPLTPRAGTDGSTLKSNASNASDNNVPKQIPKMLISRALKFDVDLTGLSKRPEYFTIHVDRVHNPENAFHLRLEWLNTTPKLIEDAVVNISRVCDRYGLKLVQVPMEEIYLLPNDYPFCSLAKTKFVLEVPGLDPEDLTDADNPLGEDLFYYHKYFLRKMGFVVDFVAASSLMKSEIDIEYSWGRPDYGYDQYIHKSGLVIAQIVQNEFVLMINSLYLSRISVASTGIQPSGQPGGLPLTPPIQQPSLSPTDIIDKIKSECENSDRLRIFFNEARTTFIIRRRKSSVDATYGGTNSDSSGTSTPLNTNPRFLVLGP